MTRKKAIVAALVVLAIGAGIAAWFRFREAKEVGVIRVSGNIEVTDVEVSFKIPGRLLERSVDASACAGTGLVTTDPAPTKA